jgi:hypothetical protein
MQNISKNIYLHTLFCPTLGWRLRNDMIQKELSLGEEFRMEQGKEVGRYAREMYPEGIYICGQNNAELATLTRDLLNYSKTGIFFEATFVSNDCIAKADIVIKNGDSLELIEVKSGVTVKDDHIYDMAYTTLIALDAGIKPTKVSLLTLDKNYRIGMDPASLFKKFNATEAVFIKVEEFRSKKSMVESVTSQSSEPKPKLSYNCKQCDHFSECMGQNIEAHIFQIPRIQKKAIEELISQDICSINDIPDHFPLSTPQRNYVDCVKCCEVQIDQSLSKKLTEVQWPAFYLDFETTMTAIPLHPNTAPYDQIPIQYSIHQCERYGHITKHIDYLADPHCDCRRELAERLIHDLEGQGSIITYSNFERTTISNLICLFPNLSRELQSLLDRIVDLEKFVKCIQHPQFRGRTSIKVVLPVLVKGLSYECLEISDGDTAMVTFAMMAKGHMDPEEEDRKRIALLEYCMLDTLAMVKLHEELNRFVNYKDLN